MELKQLDTFRAVAEARSFTRAAEALAYAQSSVTAQVQALEQELGVKLFERLGRRVALSEAGLRLLPYAERLAELSEEAATVARGGDGATGTLRVGTPESVTTYRLPPFLAALTAKAPGVRLAFRAGSCAEHRASLATGELDAAFLLEPWAERPGLKQVALGHEAIVLLARPEHALAQGPVPPEALRSATLLLTEAGCSYREIFERQLAQAGVRPASVVEFHSVEAIKACAMGGLGVAFLPRMAVQQELAAGRLREVDWQGEGMAMCLQLAWHEAKWRSPALLALLEAARESLGAADTDWSAAT